MCGDLAYMNTLILNLRGDSENPEWHCGVNHVKLCQKKLMKRITAFKCVIQQGVIDVMVNQAMLPKKGKNILDSMFNQLWEYGEKGPTMEVPGWCKDAINAIDKFQQGMEDVWTEVFDCWEREFLTRLWRLEVEHHGGGMGYPCNWKRHQIETVATTIDHVHPIQGDT